MLQRFFRWSVRSWKHQFSTVSGGIDAAKGLASDSLHDRRQEIIQDLLAGKTPIFTCECRYVDPPVDGGPAIAALTKNSVLVVWKRDIGGNSSRVMPLRSITSVKSGKWNLEISTINGESVRPVSFGSPAIGQLASEINKLIS